MSAFTSKVVADSSHHTTSVQPGSVSTSNDSTTQFVGSRSNFITDRVSNSPRNNVGSSNIPRDIEQGQSPTRQLHLLCCLEKKRHTVDLRQELITHVTNDRELFRALRNGYHIQKGKLRPFWSFRTVSSIHFMKVRNSLKLSSE
jgi:hypothetical protein